MRILWLFLFCCSLFLPAASPIHAATLPQGAGPEQANTPSASHYETTPTATGVALQWRLGPTSTAAVSAATIDQLWATLQTWPQAPLAGYQLPMRLEAVLLPDNGAVTPVVTGLEAALWSGDLPAAEPVTPLAVDWASPAPPPFANSIHCPPALFFCCVKGECVAFV